MSEEEQPQRKESEIQAAEGQPDPELESLIAPQGYAADFVDEIAEYETPQDQRRQGIRFFIMMILFVALGFWFCTPADLIIPENLDDPAPYGIDDRPNVPTDVFLRSVMPRAVGDFELVDLKDEKAYDDPYVGADIVKGTYINEAGVPVIVVMIQAESYINARRYLENYKILIENRATVVEWEERLHIEDNYIRWNAPDFADQAYGIAWNNDSHFISVTSPLKEAQEALAAEFPY